MKGAILEGAIHLWCDVCRSRDAEVISDPDCSESQPMCFDCVEDELERLNAVGIAREMGTDFAEILHRAHATPVRPLPPPRVDWRTADMSKVNALRAQWLRFQATLTEARRCWAIVHDGSRCVREAAERGVCETHAALGCRLPGLGWRGGEPQGRIVIRRGARREERVI